MSNKGKLIGLSAIIIIAIILLVALTLPLTGMFTTNEVAIIQINGEISYDNNATENMSIESIESGINDANNNPSVKAMVIEINSQGGSLVASEEIEKLIKSSKKPTVAWISDYGTSEAYLIASGADTIVASHSSAIGGIGLNLAYNQKYNNLNSNKSDSMIKQDYNYLIKEVAKNRGSNVKQISEIANLEVYNGNEALNFKLIDKIGDKEEAINVATSKANLTNYTLVKYPKDHTTELTSFLNQEMNSKEEINLNSIFDTTKNDLNNDLKDLKKYLQDLEDELNKLNNNLKNYKIQ